MSLCRSNVVFRRIGADHRRTQPRERFRQDAAAAADIQHPKVFQAVELFGIAAEAGRCLIPNIGEPDRVELVQRRHADAGA